MMKGSKSSKSSASKTVATVGYISTVPGKTTVTFKGGKGGGEGSYMNKSRVSFGGKQTGCYGRAITKEKASAGEFQWKRSPTMTKGSKSSKSSASKTVATVGYISTVPRKTTVTFKGGKGGGEGSYMNKSRVSFGDKQTGCYGRATTKEKASAGEFQWKNGTSGTKSEYKKSSTLRIGDQSGYMEVYSEQRVRNVSYNKSSGSKNFIAYDNGDGGEYGGYDCY